MAALALTAAAAIAPATAHARIGPYAIKMANAKAFAIGETCRASAGMTSAGPGFVATRPVEPKVLSALDRIRISQEQPAVSRDGASAQDRSTVIRAMTRGADRLQKADWPVVASRRADCTTSSATMAAPAADDERELGTIAIPVASTRFDDRWSRVRRAPSAQMMQAQLDRAAVTQGLDESATLDRVNRWVNRQIVYAEDERNYRQRDFWATAEETIALGSGDCEDFAILKMHMLRATGIDDDRMKLVVLRDMAINADHAFLLVRSTAGWVVLDNLTDRIYDGRQGNAVRPIMSFSGDRRWVHGYGDMGRAIVMAARSTTKASVADSHSAASATRDRGSFKTAVARAPGIRLALAHVSIGNNIPRMVGRWSPRGSK